MSPTETASATGLVPIGAPVLPGGTEAHIRRMTFGRVHIFDGGEHGLMAASPYWIVPAATLGPILEGAGTVIAPGSYDVVTTGRIRDRKAERLGSDPPAEFLRRLVDEAATATTPVHHSLHAGLLLLAGTWSAGREREDLAYVMDAGFGLKAPFLDWLTRGATPEDRAEDGLHRIDDGVYRIRAIGDVAKPVAVWVEQYLNARYLSGASARTVARRTMYVLMPARFPA